MKLRFLFLSFVIIGLQSCGLDQPTTDKTIEELAEEETSGIIIKSEGLSCADAYITIGEDERTEKTTFIYGETIFINFNDVLGFVKEDGAVFPGMRICVFSTEGDTALFYEDMYANHKDGVTVSPLLLYANMTLAAPMQSNKTYTVYIKIWDKKGTGTIHTEMDFNIIPDENINVEKTGEITYNELYLFSKESGVVTNSKVNLNEQYYLIYEGVKGFVENETKVAVGLSMKAVDANGDVLLDEADLFSEESNQWDVKQLEEQMTAQFIFTSSEIVSPIQCDFVVWDKKGHSKIVTSLSLEL
jgi:hypothetical protein